jgi:hypothetical protein
MTIPRYKTAEAMASKLRTAIFWGGDIERDRTASYQDLREFT